MKTEETQFISLAAAAKMTNYSQDYISLLCRQGKMKAEKLGRNWVTTKEWVYEYVDRTDGKGASVVPVKVKEVEKKAEEKEKEKESKAEKREAPKPLFGSTILEMSIFCTVSVIMLANMIGFSNGIKEVNRNFNLVQEIISRQNFLSAQRATQKNEEVLTAADDAADAAASADSGSGDAAADAQICATTTDALDLMAFDKETDANVIAQVTNRIANSIMEPVTVEVYKKFAIVSYANEAAKKSLYVIK